MQQVEIGSAEATRTALEVSSRRGDRLRARGPQSTRLRTRPSRNERCAQPYCLRLRLANNHGAPSYKVETRPRPDISLKLDPRRVRLKREMCASRRLPPESGRSSPRSTKRHLTRRKDMAGHTFRGCLRTAAQAAYRRAVLPSKNRPNALHELPLLMTFHSSSTTIPCSIRFETSTSLHASCPACNKADLARKPCRDGMPSAECRSRSF